MNVAEAIDDVGCDPVGPDRADDASRRVVPARLEARWPDDQGVEIGRLAYRRAHEPFRRLLQCDIRSESRRRLVYERRGNICDRSAALLDGRQTAGERRLNQPQIVGDVARALFRCRWSSAEHHWHGAGVQDQ